MRLPFRVDAIAAARSLAAGGRPWLWFDGAAAPAGEPRVSYLAAGDEVRVCEPGGEREFLAGLGGEAAAGTADATGLERNGGFRGGWAVALGYEFGVALLGLEPASDPGAAPAFAIRAEAVLAIDHDTGVAEVRGPLGAVAAWLAEHGEVLRPAHPHSDQDAHSDGDGPKHPNERQNPREEESFPTQTPRWRRDDERYASDVEACREAIRDGDAYVLCLTDTAEARGDFDPLEIYLRLRKAGPAVRGGVIATGERALISASPERFLSLHGRRIATHPIKGTRPRGRTEADDRTLAEELGADPKERAENLMIVDLMRNDLSRVCVPGTVAVDGFLRVETHAHVHQLVSTVTGELREGSGVADAVVACFPGGSMTGAPKRRAVEILHGLERQPRGLYSGCFGWIDDGGDTELAMTIRGIELRERVGERSGGPRGGFLRALLGAGGGVTADSDPSREVEEKHLKANSLIAALYP
ncbi:anthranilate synthase component I family protein [Leucobacter ruminantium]